MAKINGSDVYVAIGGTRINAQTSAGFDEFVDMIETTNNDDSGHKTYIAGDDGATFSIEGMVDIALTYNVTQIRTAIKAKAAVAFVWGDGVKAAGGQVLSGSCLLSKLTQSAPRNDKVTWSCECTVTGAVTEGTSATTLA